MCLVLPATAPLQGLLALFLCTHREEGEAAAGTSSCVAICVHAPFFPLSYHFSFYNIYKRNWEREREREKDLKKKIVVHTSTTVNISPLSHVHFYVIQDCCYRHHRWRCCCCQSVRRLRGSEHPSRCQCMRGAWAGDNRYSQHATFCGTSNISR